MCYNQRYYLIFLRILELIKIFLEEINSIFNLELTTSSEKKVVSDFDTVIHNQEAQPF